MKSRAIALILVVAVVAMGCAPRPGATPTPVAPAVAVGVAPVQQTDLRQALTYSGSVKPLNEVSVVPKASGRIVAMPVEVGTKVQAGDVIAQIEHTTLDLGLEQARAQLLTAQAQLAKVKAGPRAENVRQAELAVDSAQARLQTVLDGPRPAAVAQAQLQVDQARQKLATIQAGSRPEAVAQAQANLTLAQARLDALKTGARPEDVAPLEVGVSQAKNALYAAQLQRDAVCGPGAVTAFCKSANATVDAAQSAVDQANAAVRARTAAPTATDLRQAQAAVDQAQAALDLAKQPYTAQDLQTAKDGVAQAEQALALASQPYTAEDVRQARNAVDTAAQQLALARQPFTDQDVQAAEAGVAQAQATVDQAGQAIKDATVTAPIAGVVTQKLLSAGAMASPAQPLVVIASDAVKVQVPAEETQVANLKVGADASIASAALASQAIPATITNVAPSGDPASRTFSVDVTPRSGGDALRPGMSVTVTLMAVEHRGILAVPSQAVVERAGKLYVYVVQGDVAHLVPVTVGLSDGKLTEVAGSVAAGARVVVAGQDQLADGERVTVAGG